MSGCCLTPNDHLYQVRISYIRCDDDDDDGDDDDDDDDDGDDGDDDDAHFVLDHQA
jgi:hypothetical protein